MVDERNALILGGAVVGLGALAWYLSRGQRCPVDIGPFQRPPEGFAPSEPVRVCEPSEKPGVRAFRSWVLRTWGGKDGGISRACPVGQAPSSAHHEGRAWDWFPPSREIAEGVIACLLQKRDVPAELARRAGLRNMIYWERTWNAGRQAGGGDGWARYKHAGNPNDTLAHRDHVHFAFSWDGANQRTSFYDVIAPGKDVHPDATHRPDVQELAQVTLGQPKRPTQYIAANRTKLTAEELRDGLRAGHVAELGDEPSIHRLRMAWAMVHHETGGTESMWNFNAGNIMCTPGYPICHALKVPRPGKEPTYYRSYPDFEAGARDYWRLLAGRYKDALPFFDQGDAAGAARALREKGWYGYADRDPEEEARVYGRSLVWRASLWDAKFGKPPPPSSTPSSTLGALLVVLAAGGGLYALGRYG